MWKRRRRPPQPSSCHACGFVSKITIKQQCSSTLFWPFSTVLLCVSVRIQKHTVPPATNNWNEKMLQKLKIFTNLDLESDPNHILSSLLNANLHNFLRRHVMFNFWHLKKKSDYSSLKLRIVISTFYSVSSCQMCLMNLQGKEWCHEILSHCFLSLCTKIIAKVWENQELLAL